MVCVKGTEGTAVQEQCLRSLPATRLYERWCWQRCSREVRNSGERRDEAEQHGSGQGPCPALSLAGATGLAVAKESWLWDMQSWGTLSVPRPAAHLLKHRCLWVLLISLFLS